MLIIISKILESFRGTVRFFKSKSRTYKLTLVTSSVHRNIQQIMTSRMSASGVCLGLEADDGSNSSFSLPERPEQVNFSFNGDVIIRKSQYYHMYIY